jgi:23S rRNA pseudouridine2604 synthase
MAAPNKKTIKKTPGKRIFFRTPKGPKPLSKQRPKDVSTLEEGQERLERAIAYMGLASRREAKELIKKGLVRVNGVTIYESGFGIITDKDIITLRDQAIVTKEAMLVYKPRGIETSKTSPESKDIHDRLPALKHLSPIGRLDKDSEGLIILSNDGTLARALTKENSPVEKEYLVFVRENVTPEAVQKLSNGIILDKVKTKPAIVKKMSKSSFTIVLTEGRKHQIRRMCDACHLTIESLLRIRIGHLKIGSMKSGFVKRIPSKDIDLLKK